MTCKDFILPLFLALGWDVYNHFGNEVSSETQVSGERADYAFYVNDVIKFFVEAKKLSADLREKKHSEQAISYAWHKSVPWAVLTDFESIKVYNAEWDEPDAERSLIFEIPYKSYLTDKRLWWLSKSSMHKGELDKYAEENFKRPKREPVDKQLAEDLVKWRDFLYKELRGWNSDKKISDKIIADSVQKLLDRFIFIRTTEDRKIEGEKLRELLRNWEENKKTELANGIKELFKYYWKEYDSKLFDTHPCDALEYEDGFLAKVIRELYKNRNGIRYDFASINADVLGSVYEQYLGKIQQEETNKKLGKRKSQGIYYTPRYIVDYIVKNTLGELLKGKSGHEAKQIKILDPACGSGSFLIKAFEVLDTYIKRENKEENADQIKNYARKVGILTSSIYGVDLDMEAVEIAQLNLLLKVLEKRELLPNLSYNIECGNSLISGEEKELKKYFGNDWKNKKPFNWKEKFKDVFKQGGFDVIIGNPPYIDVRKINKDEKKYLFDNFDCTENRTNTFSIFVEKSILLLKNGGYLSFIIPNTILSHSSYKKLREKILNECTIIFIFDLGKDVFKDATVETVVLVLRKGKKIKNNRNNIVAVIKKDGDKLEHLNFKQGLYNSSENKKFLTYGLNANQVLLKLRENSINLREIYHGYNGINTGNQKNNVVVDKKLDEKYKKVIDGKNIKRYVIKWSGKWVLYDKEVLERARDEKIFLTKPKIMLQKIGTSLAGSIDDNQLYALINTTILLRISGEYNEKFILALINSNLDSNF